MGFEFSWLGGGVCIYQVCSWVDVDLDLDFAAFLTDCFLKGASERRGGFFTCRQARQICIADIRWIDLSFLF